MTPVRSLSLIAAEIVDAHQACLATAASALDQAKLAGDLLTEAKAQVRHGEWLPWLTAHCPDISPRVAQGYMRIAREWPRLLEAAAKTKRVSYLPIRDALTILADEWTDPDELGGGGNDDDSGDDDDDEDDDEQDAYLKMFRAFFSVEEYAPFRKQFDELKSLLGTRTTTETLKRVVQSVHSALVAAPESNNDAYDSVDQPELDARRC
jgi:hypothetical protein